MSEEEKEAIEELKKFSNLIIEGGIPNSFIVNKLKITFNLIDKLQKENEDMREELQMYVDTDVMILQKELKDSINARFELQRRIDKTQKENAELKEELEHKQETIDKIMKELEEFYKKYDIISKDKIRTKIKELEEILEKRKTIDIIEEINRLEELLGDDE